jgi:hypothetical protein
LGIPMRGSTLDYFFLLLLFPHDEKRVYNIKSGKYSIVEHKVLIHGEGHM